MTDVTRLHEDAQRPAPDRREDPPAHARPDLAQAPEAAHDGGIVNSFREAFGIAPDQERRDAELALMRFRLTQLPTLKNHYPGSGFGAFDIAGDMLAGWMTITVNVAFDFVNGDPAQVEAGFRPHEFRWQPGEAERWQRHYMALIEDAWSARFPIHSTRKHWRSMVVQTFVQVAEVESGAHFTITVAKYPPDASNAQSSVCAPGTHQDPASPEKCAPNPPGERAGRVELDSNDLRPDPKLDRAAPTLQIPFDRGSASLSPLAREMLQFTIGDLVRNPAAHVMLTGHATAKPGPDTSAADAAIASMDVARARTATVRAALVAAGVGEHRIYERNAGEHDAGTGASGQRVDVQVGTREVQVAALHEGGHMVGSGDEYPEDGKPRWTPVDPKYAEMVRKQTDDVIVQASNENVMSSGSTVQRWNYAAFLKALKALTGRDDWSL